jgi:hypothetical protein
MKYQKGLIDRKTRMLKIDKVKIKVKKLIISGFENLLSIFASLLLLL